MDRRAFIKHGVGLVAVGAAGILLPDIAAATASDFWYRDRTVRIKRRATGEVLQSKFYVNGQYDPAEYRKLCWMMRDVTDGNRMASMDVGLFNLIYGIQEWAREAGRSDPIYIVNSGYRTPAHNARTEGAALNSQHVKATASDGIYKGLEPSQSFAMARYYKIGGVGLYNDFVHHDTGRVRQWRGAY